jgi:hypothetical protein
MCTSLVLFMSMVGPVHVRIIGTVYGHVVRALVNVNSDMVTDMVYNYKVNN